MKKKENGNYIVQMRYVGESKYRHYGFGTCLMSLIKEIKALDHQYSQYRIVDLDTNNIIYFQ